MVGDWAVAEERSLGAPQFLGPGAVTPGKFFEITGANLCNLVHFGNAAHQKWDGK